MLNKTRYKIQKISKEIRRDIIDLFGDTSGVCDNACSRLKNQFDRNKIKSKICVGYYDGKDDQIHFWVEIENYILDITADQFGGKNIVFEHKNRSSHYRMNTHDVAITTEQPKPA